MLNYLVLTSFALIAIALAGIISDRHLVVIMLAVELIFISSAILLISFFSYVNNPGPDAVTMLIGIWSVATAEVIAFTAFCVCIKSRGFDFDLARLSHLK